MYGVRVLGVTRLSVETEESTSIERQRGEIVRWAERHQHTIVGWVEDTDVSGAVEPVRRESFAPWLLMRADEWEILAAAKLDRISRDMLHFTKLLEWCDQRKKAIVSVTENIDSSNTNSGRLNLNLLMSFAQHERDTISQRTKNSLAHHRRNGTYAGGTIPYGFRSVKVGNQYKLQYDPATIDVLRTIIAKAVGEDGDGPASLTSIAAWLNANEVPTRYGKKWHSTGLKKILTNRILRGETTHHGQTFRNDDGEPVMRVDPLLTESEWVRLQGALADRARRRTRTQSPNMLLNVARCATCGEVIYRCEFKGGRPDIFFPYYVCFGAKQKQCTQRNVRADRVDTLVSDIVLSQIGSLEVLRRVYVPAEDHTERLLYVQHLIEELDEHRRTGVERNGERYRRQKAKYTDEEAVLLEKPFRPAEYRMVPTGQTFDEVWPHLGVNERRGLLLDGGVQVFVGRGSRSAFLAADDAVSEYVTPGLSSAVELEPIDTGKPDLYVFVLFGEQLTKRMARRGTSKRPAGRL